MLEKGKGGRGGAGKANRSIWWCYQMGGLISSIDCRECM